MSESKHALERTSPKGEKFVGTCMKCGTPNLTFADMDQPCANIAGMTEDDALLRALTPTDRTTTPE